MIEGPEVLREVSGEVGGIEAEIVKAKEIMVVKDSSKAERPIELAEVFILTKHLTAEGISKQRALMMVAVSFSLRTKSCEERRALEEHIEEVRVSCASEWIPSST